MLGSKIKREDRRGTAVPRDDRSLSPNDAWSADLPRVIDLFSQLVGAIVRNPGAPSHRTSSIAIAKLVELIETLNNYRG